VSSVVPVKLRLTPRYTSEFSENVPVDVFRLITMGSVDNRDEIPPWTLVPGMETISPSDEPTVVTV
jgi:hypothetical protein